MPVADGVHTIPSEEFQDMLGAMDKICRGSLVGELHKVGWTVDGVTEENCHRRGTHVSARSQRLHNTHALSASPKERQHRHLRESCISDTFASRPGNSFKKVYRTPDKSEVPSMDKCSPREAWFQHRPGEHSPAVNSERGEVHTLPEFHTKFYLAATGRSPAPSPRMQPVARQRSAPASWRSSVDSKSSEDELIDDLPLPASAVDACWRLSLRSAIPKSSLVSDPDPMEISNWTPTPDSLGYIPIWTPTPNASKLLWPEREPTEECKMPENPKPTEMYEKFDMVENLLRKSTLEPVRQLHPHLNSTYVTPRHPESGRELADHVERNAAANRVDVRQALMDLAGNVTEKRHKLSRSTAAGTPGTFCSTTASNGSRSSKSSPRASPQSQFRSMLKIPDGQVGHPKRQVSKGSSRVSRTVSTDTGKSSVDVTSIGTCTPRFSSRNSECSTAGVRGASAECRLDAFLPASPGRLYRNVGTTPTLRGFALECTRYATSPRKDRGQLQTVPSESIVTAKDELGVDGLSRNSTIDTQEFNATSTKDMQQLWPEPPCNMDVMAAQTSAKILTSSDSRTKGVNFPIFTPVNSNVDANEPRRRKDSSDSTTCTPMFTPTTSASLKNGSQATLLITPTPPKPLCRPSSPDPYQQMSNVGSMACQTQLQTALGQVPLFPFEQNYGLRKPCPPSAPERHQYPGPRPSAPERHQYPGPRQASPQPVFIPAPQPHSQQPQWSPCRMLQSNVTHSTPRSQLMPGQMPNLRCASPRGQMRM